MPHKFNAARRHKFEKMRYRVADWAMCNESLRQRGDLTVWFNSDPIKLWAAPQRKSRGGQPPYSDMAITICLTFSAGYGLPLRQTQGLMPSLARLMGLDISDPDLEAGTSRSGSESFRNAPNPVRSAGPSDGPFSAILPARQGTAPG
jgi:hypothetical protein